MRFRIHSAPGQGHVFELLGDDNEFLLTSDACTELEACKSTLLETVRQLADRARFQASDTGLQLQDPNGGRLCRSGTLKGKALAEELRDKIVKSATHHRSYEVEVVSKDGSSSYLLQEQEVRVRDWAAEKEKVKEKGKDKATDLHAASVATKPAEKHERRSHEKEPAHAACEIHNTLAAEMEALTRFEGELRNEVMRLALLGVHVKDLKAGVEGLGRFSAELQKHVDRLAKLAGGAAARTEAVAAASESGEKPAAVVAAALPAAAAVSSAASAAPSSGNAERPGAEPGAVAIDVDVSDFAARGRKDAAAKAEAKAPENPAAPAPKPTEGADKPAGNRVLQGVVAGQFTLTLVLLLLLARFLGVGGASPAPLPSTAPGAGAGSGGQPAEGPMSITTPQEKPKPEPQRGDPGAKSADIFGCQLRPGTLEADLLAFLDQPGGELPRVFPLERLRYRRNAPDSSDAGQIDSLARILQTYPAVEIELRGHSSGDENERGAGGPAFPLSLLRADHVKLRLVQQGVSEPRLRVRGLGTAGPVAEERTEPGRERNRRVEVAVLRR